MEWSESRIFLVASVLAILLWFASMLVVDNTLVHVAVLLTVGVVVPTIIIGWKKRSES